MTSIVEQKCIYDNIYATVENYNFYDEIKNKYVDAFANLIDGKIIDAGCGEGIHLKRLMSKGYDIFGIEISEVCCRKFLKDIPHENIDILSFCNKGKRFDGLICMDLLEHIAPSQIEETVEALSGIAPTAFFGIANHSDVINGVELHPIKEDSLWWTELLGRYYSKCYVLSELSYDSNEKIFYMIYCYNDDIVKKVSSKITYTLISDLEIIQYFNRVCNDIVDSMFKRITHFVSEVATNMINLESNRQEIDFSKKELESANKIIDVANKELELTKQELDSLKIKLEYYEIELQQCKTNYAILENTKSVRASRYIRKLINKYVVKFNKR